MKYIELLRPKHWVKNLFLFIPVFFAGEFLNPEKIQLAVSGIVAFSLVASVIYVMNDIIDMDADRLHPKKSRRPLAAGDVSVSIAIIIALVLLIVGLWIGYTIKLKFLFILLIYFFLNVGYTFGLKKVPILDIFIVAAGFVIRVKAGGIATYIPVTAWLNVMIFLLALLLTIAKRRDDVLIKSESGVDLRDSTKNYNLEFVNSLIVMVSGIIIVAYLMYCFSGNFMDTERSYQVYYTSIFVLAGTMRYLQLVFVKNDTGSPTNILYKDRFIQLTILLWILSFVFIIYTPNVNFFQ
ncbi:MAG: UbiA prenyltransferase family protein [Cyclobacteriaceae bacterium]